MDINPYVVLGSAVVGLLVGLTGAGGGALMTPMLILLFNVKPSAAISSDLVAAVVMRPVGSLVHMGRGTVNYRLVGWMCVGSVPLAFLGSYLLHLLGGGEAQQQHVEIALGAALLAGTAAMVLRSWLDQRSGQARTQSVAAVRVKQIPCTYAPVNMKDGKEGYRGWCNGMGLMKHLSGKKLEAAYEYMNWYMSGWQGAFVSRYGYYSPVPSTAATVPLPNFW